MQRRAYRDPPSATVTQLFLADPMSADAYVGVTLAPTVRLLDATNGPVAGVQVRFASARGTTMLASTSAVTDASGVALPPGEYELVVSRGDAAGPISYRVPWSDSGGDFVVAASPVYTVRGVNLESNLAGIGFDVSLPDAGIASAIAARLVVSMRDPSQRRLEVSAQAEGAWEPVIAVYGNSDASTTQTSLAVQRGAGRNRTIVVDVPAGYQDAVVYVARPRPIDHAVPGSVRIRVN